MSSLQMYPAFSVPSNLQPHITHAFNHSSQAFVSLVVSHIQCIYYNIHSYSYHFYLKAPGVKTVFLLNVTGPCKIYQESTPRLTLNLAISRLAAVNGTRVNIKIAVRIHRLS